MPGIGDWIGDPLSYVDNYLKQSSPDEYAAKVSAFFNQKICEPEDTKQWIPSLNCTPIHDLKPNSLVRFRCMVQDMFGPEHYYDTFESEHASTGEKKICCGKYRDVTEGSNQVPNFEGARSKDREVFYCVPVPAECSWVKQKDKASCLSPRAAGSSKAANFKRSREDESADMEVSGSEAWESNKRTRSGDTNGVAEPHPSTVPTRVSMNFPLPGETGPAAIVKLYDGAADQLKLNSLIEVYGIISTDPSLALVSPDEMFGAEEQKAHNPPSSLVPRLHAVHITNIASSNPLVTPPLAALMEKVQRESQSIREDLLSILEHALCGDRLAAEYLLCHLLSSVYKREGSLAVGKLSLNLTGVPAAASSLTSSLVELLESCVPNLYHLPLSLANLNKLTFVPVKDHEANRLVSGVLQLPARTQLVLDESALQPGQLDTQGVANLTALGNLMQWQNVAYDFKFHSLNFETDVRVLTMSEGKSLLTSDVTVPLELSEDRTVEERREAIRLFLGPALLDSIRLYLTLLPDTEFELNMAQELQEDFVKCRQENKSTMTVEDFQCLLVLSRLLAISYGQTTLNSDLWSKAKLMEEQRKLRLQS